MKVAIVGSRGLTDIDLSRFVPAEVTEIVSGGARGVDSLARAYAKKRGIPLTEFLPNYELHGRRAPLVRNEQIAQYCDVMLAFWDGKSTGTKHAMRCAALLDKPVYFLNANLSENQPTPCGEENFSRPIEDFF